MGFFSTDPKEKAFNLFTKVKVFAKQRQEAWKVHREESYKPYSDPELIKKLGYNLADKEEKFAESLAKFNNFCQVNKIGGIVTKADKKQIDVMAGRDISLVNVIG